MTQFLLGNDPLCTAHGWMSHVFLHEAAHAVAAIDRGLEFNRVIISTPMEWLARHGGLQLGGVHFDCSASDLVLPNPRKAMEMALAGALVEQMTLGHNLNQSQAGDMALWAHGAGLVGPTPSEVAEALEAPLSEVIESTKQWLAEAYPRIKAVSGGFAGTSSGSMRIIDYDSGPWSLTYDEVVALSAE